MRKNTLFSLKHARPCGYCFGGHLAEQLGKRDLFRDYYDPLEAPGQSAWINLLKGEKVVILLD